VGVGDNWCAIVSQMCEEGRRSSRTR
jgi:hypothetical protein